MDEVVGGSSGGPRVRAPRSRRAAATSPACGPPAYIRRLPPATPSPGRGTPRRSRVEEPTPPREPRIPRQRPTPPPSRAAPARVLSFAAVPPLPDPLTPVSITLLTLSPRPPPTQSLTTPAAYLHLHRLLFRHLLTVTTRRRKSQPSSSHKGLSETRVL